MPRQSVLAADGRRVAGQSSRSLPTIAHSRYDMLHAVCVVMPPYKIYVRHQRGNADWTSSEPEKRLHPDEGQRVTPHDGTTTSPTLLDSVRDWRNMPAWHEFFRRYDALLAKWCRSHSLNAAAVDEIREGVWIELARRMQTFRYDPQKSFRGWLRELCRSRTIDFLRTRQRESRGIRPLEKSDMNRAAYWPDPMEMTCDELNPPDLRLRDLAAAAEIVQAAVRKRIKPQTWEIFWQIGIANRPIGEVAAEFQMTYAAAFQAFARARQLLREEGDRIRGSFFET